MKPATHEHPRYASAYPEDWTDVSSFSNSWVNFGSIYQDARYRKLPDGTVHIQGLIKNGSIGSSYSAFTLPVGYRPAAALVIPTITNTGVGYFEVRSDGKVATVSGGNGYFSISCCFSV
jgi:hypothetical protein